MQIELVNLITQIAILLMSVVIHEVSHGTAANALGDPTAKYAGRLTLNPIKHLDPFGSLILPFFTLFLGGFIFGWAKPVPFNPYNLKNQKRDSALIGLSGPLSNLLIAIVFGLFLRTNLFLKLLPASAIEPFYFIVFINLVLAIFNLIPVPPLDGSKILSGILPARFYRFGLTLENEMYGLLFLIIFIILLAKPLMLAIRFLFSIITGI